MRRLPADSDSSADEDDVEEGVAVVHDKKKVKAKHRRNRIRLACRRCHNMVVTRTPRVGLTICAVLFLFGFVTIFMGVDISRISLHTEWRGPAVKPAVQNNTIAFSSSEQEGEAVPQPKSSSAFDVVAAERRAIIEERRNSVREGMIHAWKGYTKFAWGQDDLRPVSHEGKDWLQLGLTIVDALDTLFIMELYDDFQRGRDWIANSLNFRKNVDVSMFETTIRSLGGMLSAYDLSKDKMFLDKAKDLADILIKGYDTPTGIPLTTINLWTGHATNPSWNGGNSILSEVGTMQLEFSYLSKHLNNPEYKEKALHVYDVLHSAAKTNGLYPVYVNPNSGQFSRSVVTLGALGDSFYEYLLKTSILLGGPETEGEKYRAIYDEATQAIVSLLIKKSNPSGFTYLAEYEYGSAISKMDELACFAGAMFALGSTIFNSTAHPNRDSAQHLAIGKELTRTCHEMWARMPTGIAPEIVKFGQNDFYSAANHYLLRPESYFVLWRITGDPIYQEWGWEMWQAIDKHCRCPDGGYSGLKDVTTPNPVKDDEQPSYFLAETLKYLYLLFSPNDVIPLDKYVFNTEAHPLSIFRH